MTYQTLKPESTSRYQKGQATENSVPFPVSLLDLLTSSTTLLLRTLFKNHHFPIHRQFFHFPVWLQDMYPTLGTDAAAPTQGLLLSHAARATQSFPNTAPSTTGKPRPRPGKSPLIFPVDKASTAETSSVFRQTSRRRRKRGGQQHSVETLKISPPLAGGVGPDEI